MLAEQKYRAAIIALRDGQWEQAAKHLLELMTDAPGYRNVPQVLMTLEETRAQAYWRAAFTFAIERGALDHAHLAIEKLSKLAPDMSDLPRLLEMLQANREAGWQPAHPLPSPAEPAVETDTLPGDETAASWLTTDEFKQEMALAMADLPTADGPALPAETTASPPSEMPPTPAPDEPASEQLPRVLKSAMFNDSQPDMNITPGPVYNALGEPRALKSATFLEETIPHVPDDTDRPLTTTYETKPHALPEHAAAQPPARTDEDTRPVPISSDEWPEASALAARQVSRQPAPIEVSPEDLIDDELSALREAVRARPRRRLDRLVIGLVGILVVVILAGAVILGGQSGAGGLIDVFGGVQGGASSDTTSSADNLQALIRAIDTQLRRSVVPRSADTALATLRNVTLDATEEASDLQQALLDWIAVGREMLAATAEVNQLCVEGQRESRACQDALDALETLQEAVTAARDEVCSLLSTCPGS